ncbi:LuxR C-terminal-related transcriptional regulator [Streptomyces rimosus]|uniref:response regulator transcription factor n=1 Tax=Streptomyces rimosus TaxID=1927 RepID=UPI00099D3022
MEEARRCEVATVRGLRQGDWAVELERVCLLSDREEQVFRLLGDGHSNRAISLRLNVTERTVKAHVAQILEKLRVESRLQAGIVSYAHRVLNESPAPCFCGFGRDGDRRSGR